MKNNASTVAMKVAHKIKKVYPLVQFSTALRYAWRLVKHSIKVANLFLQGAYKVATVVVTTMLGQATVLEFKAKGFKNTLKRLAGKAPTVIVNPWVRFASSQTA